VVVAKRDGYGYDLVRRLRAAGLSDVGDASVYDTLRRLYRAGALISYLEPSDEGPHRRYTTGPPTPSIVEAAAGGGPISRRSGRPRSSRQSFVRRRALYEIEPRERFSVHAQARAPRASAPASLVETGLVPKGGGR
jgi:hypothetical protein